MSAGYRSKGRKHLSRAKVLFEAGDEESLVYCALELRMTIEAHVYHSASYYLDELPQKNLSKWQPHLLLRELLAIDPRADATGTLSIKQDGPADDNHEWVAVGTQKHLALKEVNDSYHRLGKYLHIETVIDSTEGKLRDYGRLRDFCSTLIERLAELHTATIHGLKLGNTTQIQCFVCDATIKRRTTSFKEGEPVVTQCGDGCYATYSMELKGDQIEWKARFDNAQCAQPDCDGTIQIWERHQQAGNSFICPECRKVTELRLCLAPEVKT